MDAIMDLTARAVSFITFMQDVFLKGSVQPGNNEITQDITKILASDFEEDLCICIDFIRDKEALLKAENGRPADGIEKLINIESKIAELVWIRAENLDDKDKEAAKLYIIQLCTNLKDWLIKSNLVEVNGEGAFALFYPPYVWREAISTTIYANVNKREALAKALEYVPIHIILALGGGIYDAPQQRLLLWWQLEEAADEINANKKAGHIQLNAAEETLVLQFKKDVYKKYSDSPVSDAGQAIINTFYSQRIIYLLRRYEEIRNGLLANNAPLSFEYVFYDELIEISKNRELREKELLLAVEYLKAGKQLSNKKDTRNSDPKDTTKNNVAAVAPTSPNTTDIMVRAKSMRLFALAFSGGGIRSATFNLGILQGLAKKGVISKVDYLSTVSGGGYIGSWLATWIKRDGSVAKVTDRLNPQKSPDPLGEEVRPIRWLRMFSNYFAPNKSLMSVDSWTVGVTWLRNMLLNQVIILLLLLTLLLFGNIVFELWRSYPIWGEHTMFVNIVWIVLLFVIAMIAGMGMHAYLHKPLMLLNKDRTDVVHNWLKYFVIAGAFIISAYFFSNTVCPTSGTHFQLIFNKIQHLYIPGLAIFVSLLLIAYLGGYQNCIKSFNLKNNKNTFFTRLWSAAKPHFIIITTAVLSTLVGIVCLAFAWNFLQSVKRMPLRGYGPA